MSKRKIEVVDARKTTTSTSTKLPNEEKPLVDAAPVKPATTTTPEPVPEKTTSSTNEPEPVEPVEVEPVEDQASFNTTTTSEAPGNTTAKEENSKGTRISFLTILKELFGKKLMAAPAKPEENDPLGLQYELNLAKEVLDEILYRKDMIGSEQVSTTEEYFNDIINEMLEHSDVYDLSTNRAKIEYLLTVIDKYMYGYPLAVCQTGLLGQSALALRQQLNKIKFGTHLSTDGTVNQFRINPKHPDVKYRIYENIPTDVSLPQKAVQVLSSPKTLNVTIGNYGFLSCEMDGDKLVHNYYPIHDMEHFSGLGNYLCEMVNFLSFVSDDPNAVKEIGHFVKRTFKTMLPTLKSVAKTANLKYFKSLQDYTYEFSYLLESVWPYKEIIDKEYIEVETPINEAYVLFKETVNERTTDYICDIYDGDKNYFKELVARDCSPYAIAAKDDDLDTMETQEEETPRTHLSTYDYVNHPQHYNNYDVEVIEMMRRIWGDEAVDTWAKLTAFKYRMRMGTKPDTPVEQDLEKENFYLNYRKQISNQGNTKGKFQETIKQSLELIKKVDEQFPMEPTKDVPDTLLP